MFYFRCRYQCLFNLLMFCVLLGFVAVCGCSESENRNALAPAETTTHPISEEMVTEVLAAVEKNRLAAEIEFAPQLEAVPMAPMLQRLPTIAEVMAQLRLEFPGNVLDKDFTRIREIIESETYLDFLKRTHPLENPFQTFDEFWTSAAVDTEGYLEFLNEHFKPPYPEPTGADVSVLHYMALQERHINIRLYHGEDIAWDTRFEMMINDPVNSWMEQRFVTDGRGDIILLIKFLVQFSIWVEHLQEEDQERIQAFFLEHGVQKGFLRLALEEPMRLGYVLKDFTDVKVFKKWVDGGFRKK